MIFMFSNPVHCTMETHEVAEASSYVLRATALMADSPRYMYARRLDML
jgi:hypothetical protein